METLTSAGVCNLVSQMIICQSTGISYLHKTYVSGKYGNGVSTSFGPCLPTQWMSIVVKFTWPTLLVHRQSSRRRRSTYQSGLEVMFDDDNDQEHPSCVYLYGCFKSPCDLIPAYLTYQRSRNGSLDRVLYMRPMFVRIDCVPLLWSFPRKTR